MDKLEKKGCSVEKNTLKCLAWKRPRLPIFNSRSQAQSLKK
jgi:hypothetical protein